MPGRHVRFSTENSFHSPPPHLSSSISTASSPSGPFTPPSLPYASLPGPTPFAPRRSYTDGSVAHARAHRLMAFAESPLLSYDISLHPSTVSTRYHGLSSAGMLEPAVYPPQPTFSIVTPHLPWTILVVASNGRYATVSDALTALYRALRVNVTPAEFNSLGTHKLMRRAAAAYTHRYMRLNGRRGYAEEKAHGVKRVDFLMGCTKFRGLSPTESAGVWRLHLS
ncbi:hypothetical protein B0H17DRAFT_1101548 [Mycena rosella]|uniref:DUF6699 domain-containing protein n=1 Tax=Mycena rosella TaxID=1033263 RepID=A0AAD7G3C4_MYCRO|nr:hypothetical protein B0H17DRAFT_1106165 [Mycena rosella]KAJ7652271.1 hypothetical protein B0H17DRAFT_1101548 [Mycena rosella]